MTTTCPMCQRDMTGIDFPVIHIKSVKIHALPDYICINRRESTAAEFDNARDNNESIIHQIGDHYAILLRDLTYRKYESNYYVYDNIISNVRIIYAEKVNLFNITCTGKPITRQVFEQLTSGMNVVHLHGNIYNIFILNERNCPLSPICLFENVFHFGTIELTGTYI